MARADVLITVAELEQRLASPTPPALLDVRWSLAQPEGRGPFEEEHLPGAVFVDLPTQLAGPASPREGRHPLPAPADLEAAARGWGLREGQQVVVYDDDGGRSAARAWWLLRWAGLSGVRLLDGGLAAWRGAGGPVATGAVEVATGDVRLPLAHGSTPQMATIDAEGAAALADRGVLLDARAAQRYRGEQEPVDPRAGHIPGALSAPAGENLDDAGRFLGPAELGRRFAAVGALPGTEVAAYCGSGVTACHQVAALAAAGITAALYPGSWSQWSNDQGRPVATGPGRVRPGPVTPPR